jgi:hypothetical protein
MGILDQCHIISHSRRLSNSGIYTIFRLTSHHNKMFDATLFQFFLIQATLYLESNMESGYNQP